jgi:hypothetical protein
MSGPWTGSISSFNRRDELASPVAHVNGPHETPSRAGCGSGRSSSTRWRGRCGSTASQRGATAVRAARISGRRYPVQVA